MAAAILMAMPTVSGLDITVNDGVGVGSGWYAANRENQEVEPNTITGQVWDMESFEIDHNAQSLIMTGGYNFTNPAGLDGFRPGDLFIDINGGSYDYVAVIGNAPSSYNVYTLGSTFGVFYGQNSLSNPWRYDTGGSLVAVNKSITYSSFVDGEGTHYQANIDIAWLLNSVPNGSTIKFHNTMECGNDNLIGQYTLYRDVPEASDSQYLFGIGILCMMGYRKFVS